MRIGSLAERVGVNPTTIRYYEEVGLLREPDRTPAGYRDYDEAALARLSFIKSAQSVGLTLGEVREVLELRERGEAPCPHVLSLIEQHVADLEERIAALDQMRRDLIGLAKAARRLPPREAEFCHIIEKAPRS